MSVVFPCESRGVRSILGSNLDVGRFRGVLLNRPSDGMSNGGTGHSSKNSPFAHSR